MVLGRTVEGRGDDLALHRALHVGDLLGTLVDEHDHEVGLRVVLRDRVGDLLQHDRLAGLGGRDDEAALALADRRDEVDHALRELLRRRLHAQALLRVQRRQVAEFDAVRRVVRREAVDRVDLDERVVLLAPVLLALARLLDRSDDRVALAQVVLLDLPERDVDVLLAGEVTGRADEGVVVEDVEDAGDRDEDVVLGDLGLELVALAAAALAATAAAPVLAVALAPAAVLSVAALSAPVLAIGGLPAAVAAAVVALLGVAAVSSVPVPAAVAAPPATRAVRPVIAVVVALLGVALVGARRLARGLVLRVGRCLIGLLVGRRGLLLRSAALLGRRRASVGRVAGRAVARVRRLVVRRGLLARARRLLRRG